MGAALKFKQSQVPRQQGEQARLKVIKGPDVGAVFVVQGAQATIGRGDENDIVISDLKSSRRHAQLVLSPSGWSIEDLGSSNGILCNGKVARNGALKTKDTFGVGETLFEFMTQEAPTVMLTAPAASEQQILAEQSGFEAQRAKVIAISQFGGLAKNIPRPAANPELRPRPSPLSVSSQSGTEPKKLLMILGVLGLGYFLMASPDAPLKKRLRKKPKIEREKLSPPDVAVMTPQLEKAADVFYHNGFREYRLGNYLRARTQFETVLQMDPNHSLSKLYLENSNQKINEEIRSNLELGKKSLDSGKLKLARGHFEYVLRLLYRDRNNPAYNEAKEQLALVRMQMEDTN